MFRNSQAVSVRCIASIGLAAISTPLMLPTAQAADGTFLGAVSQTRFGPVQVQITISNGKITSAQATQYPNNDSRSQSISQQAIPYLVQETLAAQSANIQGVGGASYTSQGWYDSLASALAKSGTPQPTQTGNQATKDSLSQLLAMLSAGATQISGLASNVSSQRTNIDKITEQIKSALNFSSSSDLATRETQALNALSPLKSSYSVIFQTVSQIQTAYQSVIVAASQDKAAGNSDSAEADLVNMDTDALSALTVQMAALTNTFNGLSDAANAMETLYKSKVTDGSSVQPNPTPTSSPVTPSTIQNSADAANEATDAANCATDIANAAMDAADMATAAMLDAFDHRDSANAAVASALQGGQKDLAQFAINQAITATRSALDKLTQQRASLDSTKYNLGHAVGYVVGISNAIGAINSQISSDQSWLTASADDKSKTAWSSALASRQRALDTLTGILSRNTSNISQLQNLIAELSNLTQKINQQTPAQTSPSSNSTQSNIPNSVDTSQSPSTDNSVPELTPEVTINNSITVTILSSKKSRIDIDSEFIKKQLIVVATKKGVKKKLSYKITTKSDGSASFTTSISLNGYTVILYNGTEELDRTTAGS